MKRRHFILMLGGASSGALSIGTGAFSSAQMERGVNVSVVDDDRAFVGYESESRVIPDDLEDDRVTLVTVKNQFAQEVTVVNATIDEGSERLGGVNLPDNGNNELDPGDSFSITAEPELPPGDKIDVAVTVTVEGTGVRAEVFGDTETRRFTIERASDPEVSNVRYNGLGTVRIETEDETEDGDVEVSVYTVPRDSDSKADSLTPPETKTFELNKNENVDGWVVAVEIDEQIYQHPSWDDSECKFDSSSGGDAKEVDDPPSCD